MFSRHRNLVILATVLFLQLSVLAYQFRSGADVPLIRHGTMYVVTPFQRALRAFTDTIRRAVSGYVDLRGARRQSQDLARELDRLRLEAQRLRNEASQARRLQALLDFRQELPLATVAARVIGSGASETSRTVILDKGRNAGLRPDLPVIVPAGVVGKVLRVFADTAQVLLITDANAGVACLLESSRIHGVLRGTNKPLGQLHYVVNGEKVEVGETLLTSGEDRIYPKGLPVGRVVGARPGPDFQEIEVRPLAELNRLEEVLVVLEQGTSLEITPTSPRDIPGRDPERQMDAVPGAGQGTPGGITPSTLPAPHAGPSSARLEQSRPSAGPEPPPPAQPPAETPVPPANSPP